MRTKSFPVSVKAAGEVDGLADGQFEAVVSVFGNVDSFGDVVMPGAFAESLAAWSAKGDPIPVIWSHRWEDPDMHVGVVLAAEERPEGLWVRGQIDTGDDASPKAKQVHKLLKGRRVTQFSFAYDVTDGAFAKRDDRDVFEIRKADLHEVGPCLIGVNRETELLAAKSDAPDVDVWNVLVGAARDAGALDDLKAAITAAIGTSEEGQPGAVDGDDAVGHAGSVDPIAEPEEASVTEPGESPTPLAPVAERYAAEIALIDAI